VNNAYIFWRARNPSRHRNTPVLIRQFAKVERKWYVQSSYVNVKRWLNKYLQSSMFNKVMTQYPVWQEGNEVVVFVQSSYCLLFDLIFIAVNRLLIEQTLQTNQDRYDALVITTTQHNANK